MMTWLVLKLAANWQYREGLKEPDKTNAGSIESRVGAGLG
jgi:hypothetical protein